MANTQGMSDELVGELLSSPQPVASAPSSSRRAGPSTFLQQRMDMPAGERPAATVTRRSNRPQVRTVEEKEATPQQPPTPFSHIVGEIVERPQQRSSNNSATADRKKSLFAQRLVQPGGFPSIINKPVGTFARKSSSAKAPAKPPLPQHNSTSEDPPRRDADSMLGQMSTQEIQENIQDLQAAMSPEMLEFLRKRGQTKKGAAPAPSAPTTKAKTQPSEPVDETKEKERLSSLMASIRTYDDLDEAYEREVGLREDGLEGKSEWDQACSLLRSTAPRQTLWAARVVCNYLERDLEEGKNFAIGSSQGWPYPTLLPVSLRCLLDANVTHTNGLVLHTYILRSLYALLQLRAPIEHVVDVTGRQESTQVIYQTVFLEDAVPTSPFGSLYPSIAATPLVNNKDGETIAYATASSSTSAQQDGEAFLKDPMWTLLSKMRIVPRIAQLLGNHYDLPEEGLVAISGILAMLSVRSPGAASAISQHASLLKSLLQQTVVPPSDGRESHFLKATVMLPIMILLNAMARQSRVVASAIPYMSILPPLLGINDEQLIDVQRWALILWRKLLRYGIGFSGLSSLVALSIKPLSEKNALAPEYCSLFATCLDCAKVFAGKSGEGLESTLSTNDQEILASAVSWLSPSVRQCVNNLSIDEFSGGHTFLTLQASILRLLASFAAASAHSYPGEDKSEQVTSMFQDVPVLTSLSNMLESDAMRKVLECLPMLSLSEDSSEATVCCFMGELVSFVSTLESLEYGVVYPSFMPISASLRGMLKSKLAGIEQSASELNQRGWIKQCHFAMTKLLFSEKDASDDDRAMVRLFAMNLIGRLDLGDEAKAAILFSNDSLFALGGSTSSSPLSALFMRELCLSDSARKQLDHSFKLQRGCGITADGLGPFATESLLSDGDRNRGAGSEAGLLPLGKMWTWQVLSGSLGGESASSAADEEVCTVVTSFLKLLIHLEDEYERIGASFDAVSKGAKLYFLLNVFLYPESILCNEDLRRNASALLDKCTTQLGPSFASEFISACVGHSQIKKPLSDDRAEAKDEKLLAVLSGTPDASSKALRATQEFSLDLCNAYIEYGAQYEEFTKTIRVLLRPQLPSTIRCEVLQRLREVSHLLVLEEETSDKAAMRHSVGEFLLEGVPPEGERDSAEVLDMLADILRRGQGGKDGFFFLFSVGTLSRALVGAMRSATGLDSMKRRILVLPGDTAKVVFETCSRMNTCVLTRSALVEATMSAKANAKDDVAADTTNETSWKIWLESQTR